MCISNLTSFWGFPVIVQVVGWFENWRRNFMFHYVWFHWFLCGGGEHKTTNSIGMCVCVCVCVLKDISIIIFKIIFFMYKIWLFVMIYLYFLDKNKLVLNLVTNWNICYLYFEICIHYS
jgi:hypothetical protein